MCYKKKQPCEARVPEITMRHADNRNIAATQMKARSDVRFVSYKHKSGSHER